jgi:hypothetical protein
MPQLVGEKENGPSCDYNSLQIAAKFMSRNTYAGDEIAHASCAQK